MICVPQRCLAGLPPHFPILSKAQHVYLDQNSNSSVVTSEYTYIHLRQTHTFTYNITNKCGFYFPIAHPLIDTAY